MGPDRGIPTFASCLRGRATLCRVSFLARLDGIAQHPLGGSHAVRGCLRHSLHVNLHGHVELPVGRLRGLYGERAVRSELFAEHFRSSPPVGGKIYVRSARDPLGMQFACVSQPGVVCNPICLHSLWGPDQEE